MNLLRRFGLTSDAWTRTSDSSLVRFSRTEAAGAAALFVAVLAALIWANVAPDSYREVWHTRLMISMGSSSLGLSLSEWIATGLMSLFFFVVGMEARHEFDVGELRDRRRMILPLLAGIGGMACGVAGYLVLNAGGPGAPGWGIAMSTDTAFALGVLAVVGPRFPQRLRVFLLTVLVVDDVVALVVIATAYTRTVNAMPLLVAVAIFIVIVIAARLRIRYGWVHAVLAISCWIALSQSGVDPLVLGLAMGLITFATPPGRGELERATDLFRVFREQPTPELARAAGLGLQAAVSPNELLRERYHRVTSFVVVPLFALSSAGIPLTGSFLASVLRSPITWGVILGYVVGKPLGIVLVGWAATVASGGRLRPTVGWLAVLGGGTLAGIGFTVSMLVAGLALRGDELAQAKAGVLIAALASSLTSLAVFRLARLLPGPVRARQLLGTAESIRDLAVPVDPERDHIRGPADAVITVVEYGDFECPYCGQVEDVVRELLNEGDLRYVWRHLPLSDVHPRAQIAAEASEAAARQGAFWQMHDLLLTHQGELAPVHLRRYASVLELDVERFSAELMEHRWKERVANDAESAELSGATGTPTFFINGIRHHGAYDLETLTKQVQLAHLRASAS
jgi:Na+/H+ antiporter NhaA